MRLNGHGWRRMKPRLLRRQFLQADVNDVCDVSVTEIIIPELLKENHFLLVQRCGLRYCFLELPRKRLVGFSLQLFSLQSPRLALLTLRWFAWLSVCIACLLFGASSNVSASAIATVTVPL